MFYINNLQGRENHVSFLFHQGSHQTIPPTILNTKSSKDLGNAVHQDAGICRGYEIEDVDLRIYAAKFNKHYY